MTIPVTQVHILRLMLQMERNLSGLQSDMRNNALAWAISASSASAPVDTLAEWMNSAAAEYDKRLVWMSDFQADAENANKLQAMWLLLGGTIDDVTEVITPMREMVDALITAPKTTYEEIVAICNQITDAINAPLSLWPE